jgi:hypothetical protein
MPFVRQVRRKSMSPFSLTDKPTAKFDTAEFTFPLGCPVSSVGAAARHGEISLGTKKSSCVASGGTL